MRDPKRIPRILEKLRVYWTKHPDLRLGQILVNKTGRSDPFNAPDDDFEASFGEGREGIHLQNRIGKSMKDKHIKIRIEQCTALSKASNCPRRKFGALLVDPERNVILADGYNGGPRGGGELCGGDTCLRTDQNIKSGTEIQVGCHHAEMNVICNAAAGGVACRGAWLIVTGEPCIMCAKLIHHAGITKVLVVKGGYMGANGVQYLRAHGVGVDEVDGPQDPRAAV